METIHNIIQESVSGGFWRFIGYWIMIALILVIPAKVVVLAIQLPLRYWSMRKNGYPPDHCDADGDFKKEKES